MSNELAQEKSPYLRQHANNPVAWRPWTSAAFEQAAKEQKPIFLSIGYATCHWCHVMEGDSFEDVHVAKLINENFVAIKVDREERPDIDQIYMRAVQALTGRGGWPLTTILSPEGKPFWGGTFLTKEQLQQLLQQIIKLWNSNERHKVIASADNIHLSLSEVQNKQSTDLGKLKDIFLANCRNRFDEAYGGFSVAPKFPPSMTLTALMRLDLTPDNQAEAQRMVVKTLEHMAMSGLCDQLSGGFHRYATDRIWKVPHFEKMLYDNALLTMTYLDAGVKYGRSEFIDVANKTLTYMLNCLENAGGGFFSGEDADSENSEGKFYLWTIEELKSVLTEEEFAWINVHFDISTSGNFHVDARVEELERAAGYVPLPENVNILHARSNHELSTLTDHRAQNIFEKLNRVRENRIRPFRDEKILTGWNGLAIAALARGYIVSKDDRFLHSAQKAAAFISNKLVADDFLHRRWCDGEVKHRGVLEDYSFLIYGLIELYEADFNEEWLALARHAQDLQDRLFWSASEGLYFDHDGHDKTLIHRTNDIFDNATPSGNSVSILNLKRLYLFTGQEDFRAKAELIVKNGSSALLTYPHGLPFFCMSTDYFLNESFLLVTNAAEQTLSRINDLTFRRSRLPHLLLGKFNTSSAFSALKKEPQAETQGDFFQLCSEKGCQLPSNTIETALEPLWT